MRRRLWLMLVAGLAIQSVAPAMAQDVLKPKIVEGAEYKTRSTQKLIQIGSIGPQDIGTEATIAVESHIVNGKPDEQGILPITSAIQSLRVDLTLPGGAKLQFDSTKPDVKAENPLYQPVLDALRKQSDLTLTHTVSPEFKVLTVEGIKEGTQLQPDDVKGEHQRAIDALPTDPVKLGDTWERTEHHSLGQGQFLVLQRRYEYQGMVDRFPTVKDSPKVAKITATDLSVALEIRPTGGLPITVKKSNLEVLSTKHTLLFDPDSGRWVDSQNSLRVKGDLIFAIMGMEFNGKLDLTLEARTEDTE